MKLISSRNEFNVGTHIYKRRVLKKKRLFLKITFKRFLKVFFFFFLIKNGPLNCAF
jgi:hypothetical protein